LITYKQLESLVKNTLSEYKEDYNTHNPEDTIDFNLTMTKYWFDPKKMPPTGMKEDSKEYHEYMAIPKQMIHYTRLVKTYVDRDEMLLIFTTSRRELDFKKKAADIKYSMIRETTKMLIIGGLEYAELVDRIQTEEKAQVNGKTELVEEK